MNFYYILIWIVSFSCIIFLIRAINASFQKNKGWIIISSLIFLIVWSLVSISINLASIIGISLWLLFLLLPSIGFNRINYLVYQQNYQTAEKLAIYLRWLHPFDGWWQQPFLLQALTQAKQGNMETARQLLQVYQVRNPALVKHISALIYWLEADWQNCLIWLQENISEKNLKQDSNLLIYYLRALGETGDINGLLAALEHYQYNLEKSQDLIKLNFIRMFTLAFAGQTEQVWYLFENALAIYPAEIRHFWLTTAQLAAGDRKFVREQLQDLLKVKDQVLVKAINWRLSHLVQDVSATLTPDSWQILARIKQEIKQENKYRHLTKLNPQKAYATYILIGLNLVYFSLEMLLGGSENINTLYRLGALVPEDVWEGQWWRLIAANFLHFGWLHLLTNMLGLYFIGPFVENYLGIVFYILTYFITGIGTMLIFSLIAVEIGVPEQLLVGASAAIMGLIGAIGAILLRGWRKDRSRLAARRLRLIILIICLQFVFDLLTPQVSFISHFLGLIIGFITVSFLRIKIRLINKT